MFGHLFLLHIVSGAHIYMYVCSKANFMGAFDFQVLSPDVLRLEEHVEAETKLIVR